MRPDGATRGSARLGFVAAAFGLAAIAILIAFVVLLPRYVVASGSMEKTLKRGDHLVVERISRIVGGAPHRGDIVVFRYPPNPREIFVHRLVAIPGDRLQLRNKRLILNGAEATEPYAQHSTSYIDPYRDNFPQPSPDSARMPGADRVGEMLQHVNNGELVIPPDCYFVMGDNRDDAADSRYFGFLHIDDIVGVAILTYGLDGVRKAGAPAK